MEVLTNNRKSAVRKQQSDVRENKNLLFETQWQKSISGDELVQRVHKHIDEIYAENKR